MGAIERTMETFLRPAEVRKGRGVSEATLYRLISQRLLTKPVRITARAVGWPASEIAAIDQARIAGKTDEQIRALVVALEAKRQVAPSVSV
jgi:prophage regulatory protein